jgi:hypothetical protein
MSVLRSFEDKLSGLVEGTFGRVFRSEVRPVELARKLAKEMDAHRTISVSRTYVPNEYVVWLSPDDRARYDGVEREVIDELSAYLLEHARRERLVLNGVPRIEFRTDEDLRLGEFGIQARIVKVDEHEHVEQAGHSETMVYEASGSPAPVPETESPRRAVLIIDGKRLVVPTGGAVIGRSRDCDIVLADSNVSRKHAQISTVRGGWAIEDLGSTNGVQINGRTINGRQAVRNGDQLEIGTVTARFEEAV